MGSRLSLSAIVLLIFSGCSLSQPRDEHLTFDSIEDYANHPLLLKLQKDDVRIYLTGTAPVGVKEIPIKLVSPLGASEVFVSDYDENYVHVEDTHPNYAISKEAIQAAEEAFQGRTTHDEVMKMCPYELALSVEDDVNAWAQVDQELKNPQEADEPEELETLGAQLDGLAQKSKLKRIVLDQSMRTKCEDLYGIAYLEKRAFDRGFQKDSKVSEKARNEMNQVCIVDQNTAWMKQLDGLEKRYHRLFIAVGLDHLVSGNSSLLYLYQDKGYSAERE